MRSPFLGALSIVILSSCGGSKQVKLTIVPSKDMNEARSCYVLARYVDDKLYGAESYEDVAAKVMAPDASVSRSVVVLPGVRQEITLPLPEKGRIAVYALLQKPEDDGWRVVFPAETPKEAEIHLGRGKMCWVGAAKGGMGACSDAPTLKR